MNILSILFVLLIASCASRTKALEKLVGTHIEELLPKWDKPKAVYQLKADEVAYVFVKAHNQSNTPVQVEGKEYDRFRSQNSYVYTVLKTNKGGNILSWEAKWVQNGLDSASLMSTFQLNPK
jgi:hypothetical protein